MAMTSADGCDDQTARSPKASERHVSECNGGDGNRDQSPRNDRVANMPFLRGLGRHDQLNVIQLTAVAHRPETAFTSSYEWSGHWPGLNFAPPLSAETGRLDLDPGVLECFDQRGKLVRGDLLHAISLLL